LAHEPLGGDAEAGARALIERVVDAPMHAPTRNDQHGVAGIERDALLAQRILQVLRRDLVADP
jgi:hypothetical protein